MRGVERDTVQDLQVHGGLIVRSTGRKDRHSKVYTAKGPRDRRVRLSANTAIQFYDVQDRLGFDRPSKAVDWLIMNAKPAIDKLAGLPPWQPHITVAAAGDDENNNTNGTSYMMEIVGTSADSKELKHLAAPGIVPEQQLGSGSDSVMGMISMKDLGLSLQSFQVQKQREQTVLPASSADLLGFGFAAGDACSVDRRNEFSFNQQPPVGLNGCSFTQRETLQFSFSTSLQQPFSFAGHFGSGGFPGMCIPPGQVHDDEDSSDVGLQEPPSSYIS